MSKVHKPRVCWRCNELYSPTGPAQKYCPDCLPKMQQWQRDKRQRNPELYNAHSRARRQRDPEGFRRDQQRYIGHGEEIRARQKSRERLTPNG